MGGRHWCVCILSVLPEMCSPHSAVTVAGSWSAPWSGSARRVVIYLRGHEGRGVGLLSKLQAYALQDNGFDTVDAQTELGLPIDAREYAAGAAILAELGVAAVRLLTNNPMKVNALREYGIEVAAVQRLNMVPGTHNEAYLRTKRDRMGHDLILDEHDKGASA